MEYFFVGRTGRTKDELKSKGEEPIVLEELGEHSASDNKVLGTLEKRRSNVVPVKIDG